MRSAALLFCLCVGLVSAGCGGKGAQCARGSVSDPSATACRTASALLVCPTIDGFRCGCVTDQQSCPGCPLVHGMTCDNQCERDEYAAECGGNAGLADAGAVVIIDDPPPGCRLVATGAGTKSAYCCSCL